MLNQKLRWTASLTLLSLLAVVAGCTDGGNATTTDTGAKSTPATKNSDPEKIDSAHAHGAWWCGEHGVPETECTRCDASLIAGFKTKGDWCKEHDLPESQCFKCDPKRAEPFVARYEAKFGKKPPAVTE